MPLVDDAVERGAHIATGGTQPKSDGYFFAPTVLVDVPGEARAMNIELFGPLVLARPFETDRDVGAQMQRHAFVQ